MLQYFFKSYFTKTNHLHAHNSVMPQLAEIASWTQLSRVWGACIRNETESIGWLPDAGEAMAWKTQPRCGSP